MNSSTRPGEGTIADPLPPSPIPTSTFSAVPVQAVPVTARVPARPSFPTGLTTCKTPTKQPFLPPPLFAKPSTSTSHTKNLTPNSTLVTLRLQTFIPGSGTTVNLQPYTFRIDLPQESRCSTSENPDHKRQREEWESQMEEVKKQKTGVETTLALAVETSKRYLHESEELRKQINAMHESCDACKTKDANNQTLKNTILWMQKMDNKGDQDLKGFLHGLTTEKLELETEIDRFRGEMKSLKDLNESLEQKIASRDLLSFQSNDETEKLREENIALREQVKSLTEKYSALVQKTSTSSTLVALQESFNKLQENFNSFIPGSGSIQASSDDVGSHATSSKSLPVSPECMSEQPTAADIPLMKKHLEDRIFTLTGFKKRPEGVAVEVVIDVAPRGDAKNYRKGILESVSKVQGANTYIKCNVRSCTKLYSMPVASLEKVVREWIVFMQ